MSPSLKKLGVNCLLSVASVTLTAVALETGSRLCWRQETRGGPCTTVDPVLVNRFKPNCQESVKVPEGELVAYHFNACGYRDHHDCSDARPATRRLFAIGDSFTFGATTPYDKTYVHVAEQALGSALSQPIEFINGGVFGWDLLQYSTWLDEALQRKPQIVTVGLLPNDLFPDISESGMEHRRRQLQTQPTERVFTTIVSEGRPQPERKVRDLMSRSRAMHLLGHLLMSSDAVYAASYKRGRGEDSYLRSAYSPNWTSKIDDARRILGEMAARAGAQGTRLVVILIPQRIQALLLSHPTEFPGLDPFAFSRRMQEVCRSLDIPVIDFLDSLAKVERPTAYYFPLDGHLTPPGQERLGRYVAEQMLGQGLVR